MEVNTSEEYYKHKYSLDILPLITRVDELTKMVYLLQQRIEKLEKNQGG